MAVRYGIDLGTTYSAISWYDVINKRVENVDLNTADGDRTIRSVVYYPGPDEEPVVGDTAWNAAKNTPDRVVTAAKRRMGADWRTPEIDGKTYTPTEVSTEILKVLAKDAALDLGEEVKEAVITVPAYFGDNEKAATKEAGEQAGLEVLDLLPEPHAAALAYSVQEAADIQDKYLLVYDLGGGTFDVTLIRATTATDAGNALNLNIETICKDGDKELGGLDWDRALAELVGEKVKHEHDVDVWEDAKNEAILMDNCEKAKRSLTRTNSVAVIADAQNHQVEVRRAEFEDRTRDLLNTTRMHLEHVLDQAEKDHGVARDAIELMLTGGASKMPMVHDMVQDVMGKPPLQYRNPELLVTIGAAYWAHLLDPDAEVEVILEKDDGSKERVPLQVSEGGLTDTGFAVGIEVYRPDGQGGTTKAVANVIPENTLLGSDPIEKVFATSEDGQTEIPIVVYEGTSEDPEACHQLMTFTITDLPPNRPRGKQVKVRMGYDASGLIQGEAEDVETARKVNIVIDRSKT